MLAGKVALVTGASRGIGREIALKLAAKGAFVVVNYSGSKERAEEVVNTMKANGGDGAAYQCDVAGYAETEAMIQNIIKEYKTLDILVNNAGITKDNLIMKMSEEDYDRVLDINLKGTFNTIRHSARQMLRQKAGKIINITSVSGVLGNAGQANYAASKAGVIGLTKTMARELASRGINVNAVAPGFVVTEMTDALPEAVRTQAEQQIPFKRFGKAEEIAQVVAFLASEEASYITGQVISVDGGMAM